MPEETNSLKQGLLRWLTPTTPKKPRRLEFLLSRDDGAMTVVPDHPDARDFLTLRWRQMTKVGLRTKVEHLAEPMYTLTQSDGHAALFSHQGFWKALSEHLEGLGHKATVLDLRPRVLDYPNFGSALRGLREFQKPWVLEALRTGNSGLLGAPTRFGKSYGMTAILEAFPNARSVVTAPGVDLCEQLLEHFKETLPRREIKGVFTGSRGKQQSDDITVCSIDSLTRMDPEATELLIIDEPHAIVSDGRAPKIAEFVRARKYGFGATLKGRFDKKDRLIEGLVGPVIANVSYLEGVAMGAIAPLTVVMLKIPFSKDTIPGRNVDREIVYQRLLTKSQRTAALVKKIMEDVVPEDWQTMAFIKDEKQAEFYMEHSILPIGAIDVAKRAWGEGEQQRRENWDAAEPDRRKAWEEAEPRRKASWEQRKKRSDDHRAAGTLKSWKGRLPPLEEDAEYESEPYVSEPYHNPFDKDKAMKGLGLETKKTIAMAKRMSKTERKKITNGIAAGDILRVLASNIYVQGLTFPDLKVVLNLAGGGANTTAIQKPGRLLQTRPNKNYGVMFDFMFECRDSAMEERPNPPYSGIVRECWARYEAYKEIGYNIEFVEDSERAREIVLGAYD